KALAIAAKKRSPLLPDVPTSHEQGLSEFDIAPFYAVFVPTGTPQAIVDRLSDALSKGLNEEAVQKRFADLGAESVEQSRRGPKALRDLVKSESERLMPILKAAAAKEGRRSGLYRAWLNALETRCPATSVKQTLSADQAVRRQTSALPGSLEFGDLELVTGHQAVAIPPGSISIPAREHFGAHASHIVRVGEC